VPKLPKVGPETMKRYDALAEEFVDRGAKKSQMFGMPVLKKGDKVFCGTFGDAMTFKLGSPEEAAAAMERTGVEAFEAWVLVPAEHSRAWKKLAEQAFERLA